MTDPSLGEGHRPPDATALAAALLGFVRHELSAQGAALLVSDGEAFRVASASPGAQVSWSREWPHGNGLTGLVLDSSRPLLADPVQPGALPFLEGQEGALAVALLPVNRRGGGEGMLACWRQAGQAFTEEEKGQLARCSQLLAGWEAFAAHTARLDDLRLRQDRVVRGLERVVGESDPQEISAFTLDALFDILPARAGFVALHSLQNRYSGLVTKGFDTPPEFGRLARGTWSHWVLTKGGEPLYLDGATGEETAMPLLWAGEPFSPASRIAFLFPLMSATGDPLGVVGLVGRRETPFEAADRAAAAFLLRQSVALLELALLNRLNAQMALTDPLTGLFNRRHFDERLRLELRRAQREQVPVALLLCDIDHFKRVNDAHGHPAGDGVLREVAQRIASGVRDVDVVCRYGGEEFAVILPACSFEEAASVAERVRSVVANVPVLMDGAQNLPVTISAGISGFPSPINNALELTRSADQALYRAKSLGRNRVEKGRS